MALNPISTIINGASKIVGQFKASPEQRLEREKLQLEYADLAAKRQHEMDIKQLEINLADANSGKSWQSGWRPFLGWQVGIGFGYQVFLCNILNGFLKKWFEFQPLSDMQSNLLWLVGGTLIGARGLEKGASMYQRAKTKRAVVEKGGDHKEV